MAQKPNLSFKPRRTVASIFREQIEKSEANGFERAEMVLRLTRGDEADLRRDRALPLEDIAFDNGVMRFLGVRVAASKGAVSLLDTAPEPIAEPEPAPPVKAKKSRAKPKVAKAAAAPAAAGAEATQA